MSEPIVKHTIPSELLLIPDSPNSSPSENQKKPEESSKPAVTPIRAVPSLSAEEIALIAEMDAKEALRCAAVLLYWASQGGTEEVSGVLVTGIAQVLHLCADRLQGGRE